MFEEQRFANLFEGQGQLAVGGGVWKELYSDPSFQTAFTQADILSGKMGLGFLVSEACLAAENSPLSPEAYNPVAAQLVLLTGQTATMDFMHANGLPWAAVNGGHSLGQLGGAVESGLLSFDTAFMITAKRAQAMSRVVEARGFIVTVILDVRKEAGGLVGTVQQGLNELGNDAKHTKISAINHKRQIVVAGLPKEIERLQIHLPQLKFIPKPDFPLSHHPVMHSAQREFNAILDQLKDEFQEAARTPLLSDVKKILMTRGSSLYSSLRVQLKNPVLWVYTLHRMRQLKLEHGLEIGQGNIFPGMTRVECPEVKIYLTNSLQAIDESLGALAETQKRYFFLEPVASLRFA